MLRTLQSLVDGDVPGLALLPVSLGDVDVQDAMLHTCTDGLGVGVAGQLEAAGCGGKCGRKCEIQCE